VNEPGRLVVPVESQRGRHGYLAILDPTGGRRFYTRAVRVLESYARLAAAALDSAAAVADARREATTARILLELSSTLAELGGVEEMATRLARAVPDVARCDRAIVALVDPETRRCRVTATCGYPPDVDAELRTHTFDPVDPMQQGFRYEVADVGDGVAQRLMARTGTVAMASVPIVANGEYAGHVVAAVSRPDPAFREDPTLADRLRGLAGQAATAVRNGRLLEQVRYQALHDALTGLPNRALILDRVDHMLAHARRQRQPAAALFIDLDGFKDVNDSFGHATGDRLLQAVAARLATTLRDSDTVGRLGGDEFVALVEGPSLAAGPEVVAERLLAVLREPFDVDLPGIAALSITASIGIAVGDRLSPTEMLRDADVALYRAKGSGKDCYVLFEPEMQTAVRDRVRLETDLRAALAEDQFFLVYQPIFDLRDDTARGAEALLRWRHPTRGVIQPDEFIPTLEDTGLIVEVGRWVLREACRRAATLMQRDRPFEMSVNVSARQLDSDAFLGELVDAIASSGIEPTSLTLEITETTIMRDADATARRLADVKALGVRIAIDDFGTGYSSLAYLRQFPVDALKIDRSFIAGLTDSDEADALVHTLVRLGKTLGIETLAEGIEEQAQYDELQQQDCDSGQGFLLAHPLAGDELERFLTGRRDPSITSG
jgi:diguanylate cyclase (GGDEF)-like protein